MPTPVLPTEADVFALLAGVVDPELGCDIVELGMARRVVVAGDGTVTVTIALTTAGCPLKAQIKRDVTVRLESTPGVTKVVIDWTEMDDEQPDVAHALEVGPHRVGVEVEGLGHVGRGEGPGRARQLEVDGVARVVAEGLQEVEPRRSAVVACHPVEFTRSLPVE